MRLSPTLACLAILTLLVLPACGGGSGGGAAAPPMASVQGMVVKDPVSGCDVRVCEVDPATGALGAATLGSGRSATGGGFGFDFLAAPGGVYAMSGRGGTFFNRATGLVDGIGDFALRGIFCADAGDLASFNMTVMSTLIAYRFEFLRTIRPYMAAKLLLRLAKLEMALAFGIGDVDACPDPAGSEDAQKLFLLDVGLVQMARDLGEPASEVVNLYCQDLMDGRPDGRICGEDARFQSGAAWSPSPLSLLGGAIALWLATSPQNDTGFGPGDPIVAALRGRLDTWVVRGLLSQVPRILSLSKRYVPESAGTEVTCHLAPYANPADIDFVVFDKTHAPIATANQTGFTTDASGVHAITFLAPSLPKGVHGLAAVDGNTKLFDVEPLGACNPGLLRIDEVVPRRGIITGGTPVKVRGEGFDAANPPNVKIGGRDARIERVISPHCLRVFTPPGLTPGPVDVEVDGVVQPGAYEYLDPALLEPSLDEGLRRILLLMGGDKSGVGTRILDGVLDPAARRYSIRVHALIDAGGPGTLSEGDFDGDVTATSFPIPGDDSSVLLDNGLLLQMLRRAAQEDGPVFEHVSASFDPTHPSAPPASIGTGMLLPLGNPGPKLWRTFDITGTCIESGLRSVIRGQATFRADGRVFLSGGITKRTDGGREGYAPLLAVGRYSVDGDGNISFSDFPPAAGFTLMKGMVGPSGRGGTVILKGPGKLVHLMLAARRSNTSVPMDGFGPNFAHDLVRAEAPIVTTRTASRRLTVWDGQTVALGGLIEKNHDTSADDVASDSRVHARPGYASFAGRLSSPEGLDAGRLGDGAGVHWDPLPQDGLSAAGDHAGSKLGYGMASGGDAMFSNRSWLADYKVLAMGIELMPDATKEPNPEHRSVMELGCLVRESDDVDVDGFSYSMASKIRWDRLKRKEVDRDAAGVVSTSISGPSSESGFALVAAGGEFYAFACPLPPEGTKCFFRGCFSADGSIGIARSSDGFGAPWHAVLLRKPRSAPPVDGTYNTRFFCHTFDGASTAYAINGVGTYAFAAGAGTYTQDTSQVAISEALASVPSGPDQYPGVFTVDADGCIDMTTDFGGGFTSDLCGAVHENGSVIVTMDPEPGAINCFTIYTLRDASASTPALVPERAKFCGLHLAFDGTGRIEAATRAGKLALRPGLLDRRLRTATWTNVSDAVTVGVEFLGSRPMSELPGRLFTSDLALGRVLSGARSAERPVVGSQSESGSAAPAGSFGVTLRQGK